MYSPGRHLSFPIVQATCHGDNLPRFSKYIYNIRSGPFVALALVLLAFFSVTELIDNLVPTFSFSKIFYGTFVPIVGPSRMLLKIRHQAMLLGQISPSFSLIALKISAAMSSTKTTSDFSRFGFSLYVTVLP